MVLIVYIGPWNLGRWSKPVGAVAVGWLLLILPALCFPAVKGKDLNALTMNYTCLIYGGTVSHLQARGSNPRESSDADKSSR